MRVQRPLLLVCRAPRAVRVRGLLLQQLAVRRALVVEQLLLELLLLAQQQALEPPRRRARRVRRGRRRRHRRGGLRGRGGGGGGGGVVASAMMAVVAIVALLVPVRPLLLLLLRRRGVRMGRERRVDLGADHRSELDRRDRRRRGRGCGGAAALVVLAPRMAVVLAVVVLVVVVGAVLARPPLREKRRLGVVAGASGGRAVGRVRGGHSVDAIAGRRRRRRRALLLPRGPVRLGLRQRRAQNRRRRRRGNGHRVLERVPQQLERVGAQHGRRVRCPRPRGQAVERRRRAAREGVVDDGRDGRGRQRVLRLALALLAARLVRERRVGLQLGAVLAHRDDDAVDRAHVEVVGEPVRRSVQHATVVLLLGVVCCNASEVVVCPA